MQGKKQRLGMVPESELGSGGNTFSNTKAFNPGNLPHTIANKIKGMSLASVGTNSKIKER